MNLYFCPSCHYIYPAATARDKVFCIDCGQPSPRPANAKEQTLYEADRKSMLDPTPSPVVK